MKKAFRIVSLVMAMALITCALVSCGNAATDSSKDGHENEPNSTDLVFYNVPGDTYAVKASETFSLSHVDIPETYHGVAVTRLMPSAFMNKTTLKSVTLPNSITLIGNMAFAECTALETITIPNGVTSIELLSFSNCYNLASITIPNSVTTFGDGVFEGCINLVSIRFEGTVAEWNAIAKGSYWNQNTGDYTVTCTDGEVAK